MLQLGQSDFIQGVIDGFKKLIEVIGHLCKTVFDMVQFFMKIPAIKIIIAELYIIWNEVCTAIDAVIEVVEVLIALWNKGMNFMNNLILKFYNSIKDSSAFKWLQRQFQNIVDWVLQLVSKAKQIWNKFREWLGLNPVKGEIKADTKITGEVTTETGEPPKANNKNIPKSSKKKTTSVKYDKGSIKDYESQLQKLNDELNSTNVSE